MAVDDRTLSIDVKLSRSDVFWIGLHALRGQVHVAVGNYVILHMLISISYVILISCINIRELILDNFIYSLIFSFIAYVLIFICFVAFGAWKAKEKQGFLGSHSYVNREDGFLEKTEANETFMRWSSLSSVTITSNALYIGTPEFRFHVIRARDVTSPSDFQQFADLAIQRFQQSRTTA